MRNLSSSRALAVVLTVAAVFILLSGQSLPAVVASHFAAGGHADGFMPRNAYLGLMLFMAVGVPFLLALGYSLVHLIPPRLVNLPNRSYWLSPERSAETFAFLRRHGIYLCALMATFLCFIHWLVVRANELQPAHLPVLLFATGLVLFLLAVAVWTAVLFVRFRR
jgi:hypothetical protein